MNTSVQYGIRHLLVLTAVVAVVAAILGPMVRAWDTERQGLFAATAAITVAALAISVLSLCRSRLRAERAAGSALLRMGKHWVIRSTMVSLSFSISRP